MNLEIEFRAKRRDADSWAFGYPYYDTGDCDFEIVETGNFAPCMSEPLGDTRNIHYPVNVNTLSQFSGIKDYLGNKIFSGDIISKKWKMEVFFQNGCFMVKFHNNPKINKPKTLFEALKLFKKGKKLDTFVIIGNIYENSDLLS